MTTPLILLALLLSPISSSTLLFYVPDSPAAPELQATIEYGIKLFSKRLWYNLNHKVILGGATEGGLVKSLVGNLDNVTAFLGVFSDQQLEDITPLVDAFKIPTFVLNQVTNYPTSPNIYLTTPSVVFEMKSLEGVLDYYKWDIIKYYVEADSSVTDTLKGRGRCWEKHIVNTADITKETCQNFSVVILVGYSEFQDTFIDHFTRSRCRNMVVLQYYLEEQPSVATADIRNSTEIGDLVMLLPKTYQMIDTGVTPGDNPKYSCLSPSCMKYKMNEGYQQPRSVPLLLDTLKLIEIPLREGQTLSSTSLRDITFVSITNEQATLLDQGFSYNRINIFKSGAVPGVELIGWSDERGLKILPTTWRSSASSEPLRNSTGGGCNITINPDPDPIITTPAIDFSDPTKIVSVILLVVMLSSVPVIYINRRRIVTKIPIGTIFPYLISCLVILLTFFFLIGRDSNMLCLVMVLRDALEFLFYSLVLFSLLSYESENKFSHMIFLSVLLTIKFIVTVFSLVKDSAGICQIPYFSVSGSQLFFALITMSILFIMLRHFANLRTMRWVLISLFVSMTTEGLIHFLNVPAAVQVALYSTRVFITMVAYIFSGQYDEDSVAGDNEPYKRDKNHQRNHSNHNYMNLNGDAGRTLAAESCVACAECADDEYPCKHALQDKISGGLHITDTPQMYWEDDLGLVHCPNSLPPPPPPILDDEGGEGPSAPFPDRVRLSNYTSGTEVKPDKPLIKQSSCPTFKLTTPPSDHHAPYVNCSREDPPPIPPSKPPSGVEINTPSSCCIQPYPDYDEDEELDETSLMLAEKPCRADHSNTPHDYTVHWSKPTEYGEEITCCFPTPPPHRLAPLHPTDKCYHVGHLSGISEEEEEGDEEEETRIRVGFRSGDEDYDYNSDTHVTNGESGFCSGTSNTASNGTEPEYVNIVNGDPSFLMEDIVYHHDHHQHGKRTHSVMESAN